MAQLLMVRERIKSFYSRYEGFCRPVLKFLLAFLALTMINKSIGYSSALSNPAIVLVIALFCSFFPINFVVVVSTLVILLHLYAVSLETVVAAGVLFMLMFLLYFRFAAKDTILLVITPLCFILKIPYVVPLCAGLVGAPTSMISTGCGVVTYYLLHYISANRTALETLENDPIFALEKFRMLIDALMKNREMMVLVAAFAITILVVYLIRRLPVDHCWTIAMITGMLVDIVVILVGDLKYATYIKIPALIIGSLVALAVGLILQFFVFNVDYTRTEKVQFEDDEYYYYVKAIPKNTVSLAERKVKKIKGQERAAADKSTSGEGSRKAASGGSKENRDVQEYRVRRTAATRERESARGGVSSASRNRNSTKRIVVPDEVRADRRERLSEIEKAAAAKARAERNKNNGNETE